MGPLLLNRRRFGRRSHIFRNHRHSYQQRHYFGKRRKCSRKRRGRGSGGTIRIVAETVAGSGSFQANGGNSAAQGGGGGGGRIIIRHNNSTFTGAAEVNGGSGVSIGEKGTAAFIDAVNNNMRISASWRFQVNDGPQFSYNSISFNNAQVSFEAGTSISADQIVVVASALSAPSASPLTISAADLEVDAASTMTADVKGFPPNYDNGLGEGGPGAGIAQIYSGGGGGHGGRGGNSSGGQGGGVVYGSPSAPTDLGSGGLG